MCARKALYKVCTTINPEIIRKTRVCVDHDVIH